MITIVLLCQIDENKISAVLARLGLTFDSFLDDKKTQSLYKSKHEEIVVERGEGDRPKGGSADTIYLQQVDDDKDLPDNLFRDITAMWCHQVEMELRD